MNSNPTHVRCTDKKGRIVMVPKHLTTTRAFKIQGLSLAPLPTSEPQAITRPPAEPASERIVYEAPVMDALLPPVTFPDASADRVSGSSTEKGKPGRPKSKK